MFYSEHVLAKKGPLGKIWLAAHWEKKLTKTNIMQTDIPSAVSQVQTPEAPMALRLSGQLLLGVVRIYSRKAKYLLDDCDEAITKIKIAFVPGAVDLAPELAQASYHSITLPENLANVDILLPDANLDFQFQPGQLQFPDPETSMMEVDFSLRRGLDFTGDFGVEPSVEQGREAVQGSDFGVDFSVDTSKGNHTDIVGDFGVDRYDYGDHGDQGYQGDQAKEGPSFTFGDDSIMFAPQEPPPQEAPAKQAVQRNRKRKLVIDERLEIATADIKDQIADFSSLLREQTFLPANKRVALEEQFDERSIETMFSLPTITDLSEELQAFVSHNLAAPEVEPPTEEIEEPRAHLPDQDFGDTTTTSEYPQDEPHREEPYQEEPHHFDEPRLEEERPQFQVGEKDQEEFPAEEEEEVPEEAEPTAATGGLSNQTLSVIDFLKTEFEEKGRDEVLNTQELLEGKTKKSVASTFFEILVLRTRGYLDVKQDEPYGNIELTARESLFHG